jgi:hypothetical protein
VIGDYPVKLKYADGSPVDLSGYDRIFIHRTSNYEHYIAVKKIQADEPRVHFIYLNEKDDYMEVLVADLSGQEYSVQMLNNFIIFAASGEPGVIKKIFIWKGDAYRDVSIDDIGCCVQLKSILYDGHVVSFGDKYPLINIPGSNVLSGSESGFVFYDSEVVTGGGYTYNYVNQFAFPVLIEHYATLGANEIERITKSGRVFGYFTWRYAIKLYDGSYIKVSPVMLSTVGYTAFGDNMSSQTKFGPNGDEGYNDKFWNTSITVDNTAIMGMSGNLLGINKDHFTLTMNIYFSEREIQFEVKNSYKTEEWDEIKDLIIGIDVFTSSQISPFRTDTVEITRLTKEIWPRIINKEAFLKMMSAFYKTEKDIIDEIKNNSQMYKVLSFDVDEIIKQ